MSEYKRLTEKDGATRVMSQWAGTSNELKIYRRLAELEDKIMNGTLVETPYKEEMAGYKKSAEIRKETAKEILQELYDHCFELVDPFCDDCEECYGSCDKYYILAIAKQYGVEVE